MQCLAILTANPCNERFIVHFFVHWHLSTIEVQWPSMYTSCQPHARSHCCVRKLAWLLVCVRKHYSYRSGKRLGWRASGRQSDITSTFRRPAFAVVSAPQTTIRLTCIRWGEVLCNCFYNHGPNSGLCNRLG